MLSEKQVPNVHIWKWKLIDSLSYRCCCECQSPSNSNRSHFRVQRVLFNNRGCRTFDTLAMFGMSGGGGGVPPLVPVFRFNDRSSPSSANVSQMLTQLTIILWLLPPFNHQTDTMTRRTNYY